MKEQERDGDTNQNVESDHDFKFVEEEEHMERNVVDVTKGFTQSEDNPSANEGLSITNDDHTNQRHLKNGTPEENKTHSLRNGLHVNGVTNMTGLNDDEAMHDNVQALDEDKNKVTHEDDCNLAIDNDDSFQPAIEENDDAIMTNKLDIEVRVDNKDDVHTLPIQEEIYMPSNEYHEDKEDNITHKEDREANEISESDVIEEIKEYNDNANKLTSSLVEELCTVVQEDNNTRRIEASSPTESELIRNKTSEVIEAIQDEQNENGAKEEITNQVLEDEDFQEVIDDNTKNNHNLDEEICCTKEYDPDMNHNQLDDIDKGKEITSNDINIPSQLSETSDDNKYDIFEYLDEGDNPVNEQKEKISEPNIENITNLASTNLKEDVLEFAKEEEKIKPNEDKSITKQDEVFQFANEAKESKPEEDIKPITKQDDVFEFANEEERKLEDIQPITKQDEVFQFACEEELIKPEEDIQPITKQDDVFEFANEEEQRKPEEDIQPKTKQDEDSEFNFVEEDNKNDEEIENKPVQINLDSEGESDSDTESEEEEEKKDKVNDKTSLKDKLSIPATQLQESDNHINSQQPVIRSTKVDDGDEFDFVVEEDENVQPNTEDKDDGFQFVEENEEVDVTKDNQMIQVKQSSQFSQVTEESNPSSIKTNLQPSEVKPTNLQGNNTERISSLLNSFKEKYLSTNLYHKANPIKVETELTMSKEHMNDMNFNYEKQNISIRRIIEKIPNSKSHPEICIRPVPIDEISNVDKMTKKENARVITDIPNSIIYKLYFKILDLKYTYINSIQTDFETQRTKDVILIAGDKAQEATPKVKEDDEFIEIGEESYKSHKTSKLEINEALLSLVNTGQVENKSEVHKLEESESRNEFDESKMMEMLKTFYKATPSKPEIQNETEEEKNTKELQDIISSLPNYRFMASKFVEYPDALFNI